LELLALRIAPEVVDPADVEMLQDLIIAAFTAAMAKVKEAVNAEMGVLAGGMGIPGFPGFPGVS
jgi:DNA-binding protein YbaB